MTTYKLLSYILVSPPNVITPKVAVVSVVTAALGSIVLTYFCYRNLSSDYIIKPYSRYYGRLVIGGYIDS